MFAILSLVVSIVLHHAEGASYCEYVLGKNCNVPYEFVPVCGTDGTTYQNNCFFAKAHCIHKDLNKAHDGVCGSGTTVPITSPGPTAAATTQVPIDGALIALDIFCLDIAYISCGLNGPRVCASNGNFYENMCEFDKARCTHRDIHSNGAHCA